MRVIVFGGAGFLGSHVADELTNRGYEVTIFDCRPSQHLLPKQKMIVGDILDSNCVEKAVDGFEVVYNFAGLADLNASISRPVQTIHLNVLGNTHILNACAHAKTVKRYIYASTLYVFSNKGSFYGVSKRCSEQIIEEFHRELGLNYSILRYGSVYGTRSDRQNRIYRILRQALLEKKIVFEGSGEEEREYIHVRDAAVLSVDVLNEAFENQHVILTGVERFRYSELLNIINEVFDNSLKIEYLKQDYRGHYMITPYSFRPTPGKKLVSNPFVDFGQGMLETIFEVYEHLREEGLINTSDIDYKFVGQKNPGDLSPQTKANELFS